MIWKISKLEYHFWYDKIALSIQISYFEMIWWFLCAVISDRDDMIKLNYHDMIYHDNFQLTLYYFMLLQNWCKIEVQLYCSGHKLYKCLCLFCDLFNFNSLNGWVFGFGGNKRSDKEGIRKMDQFWKDTQVTFVCLSQCLSACLSCKITP